MYGYKRTPTLSQQWRLAASNLILSTVRNNDTESAFYLCQTGSYGELTHKPDDATLVPGGSLRLNCTTDIVNTPVLWRFTKEGSDAVQDMTSGGVLKPNFRSLFTIDSSNQYDLIATMTDNTDAYCGTYECVDINGDRNAERANASVASKYNTSILWYCQTVGLVRHWNRNLYPNLL